MRRWFLFALIALLPLRAWVGEAMAGQMLAQHTITVQAAAASGPATAAPAMAPDCMEHAAGAPQDAQPAATDCPTCAQCQVCSSVALALPAATALPPQAAFVRPGAPALRFASAEAARGFKPPIS